MAESKLRKKDAQTIIASLEAGVVPVKGGTACVGGQEQ